MQPALKAADRHQDAAAWAVRDRFQHVAWAVRALAGFSATSLTEDRHGVLQLTEPGLGAAAQAILSLLLALQQHVKAAVTVGGRRDGSASFRESSFGIRLHKHLKLVPC